MKVYFRLSKVIPFMLSTDLQYLKYINNSRRLPGIGLGMGWGKTKHKSVSPIRGAPSTDFLLRPGKRVL